MVLPIMTACSECPHSPARPLRRSSPAHFLSPDLWTPAANVWAGQAGTETINCPGRRSESSVVAGVLTRGDTETQGPAPAPGHCCQLSSSQPNNGRPEKSSSVEIHIHFSKVGISVFLILPAAGSSVRLECVIIGKFVMSNQHNDSFNFLFPVTYFLYFLQKLQW